MNTFLSIVLGLTVFFVIILPMIIIVIAKATSCPKNSHVHGYGKRINESCKCVTTEYYPEGGKCSVCPNQTYTSGTGDEHPVQKECRCDYSTPRWDSTKNMCSVEA